MKMPVQLYIRVKLDDGSYPYLKAAMLPNGHVPPATQQKRVGTEDRGRRLPPLLPQGRPAALGAAGH